MKQVVKLFLLGSSIILFSACSDSGANNNDDFGDTETYTTANVKTEGTQYFTFSEKAASGIKPAAFDLEFTVDSRLAEVAPCVYFNVSTDPIIKAGPGVTLTRVDAASLDDITEMPEAAAFSADDTIATALVGRTWLGEGYMVNPDVYVFKSCAGNYGLLSFDSFEMDFAKMQISSIKWYFKYNADGSNDFSNALVDSFSTENAYDATRYWSFADGSLAMAYGTWEVTVEGSSIWLGPNVQAYKLDNTNINDVTTIAETGFTSDDLVNYVCAGWYDSDENHTVIPNDYVYVAKTVDETIAFEITSYYDGMGASGAFTIKWKSFK